MSNDTRDPVHIGVALDEALAELSALGQEIGEFTPEQLYCAEHERHRPCRKCDRAERSER